MIGRTVKSCTRHLLFLLVIAFVAGCAVSPRPDFPKIAPLGPLDPNASRAEHNLTIYDWVGGTVEKYYHDPHMNGVDWTAARERHRSSAQSAADEDGLYGAINGFLAELKDRHVDALSPRERKEQKERRFYRVWICARFGGRR